MTKDSRTKNSIRNIKYSTINKVVTMFLSLVGRNIFLQILPIDYLGINGVFTDIFVMMSLADLGLATAMAFSFYKPLAEGDEDKITALVTLYRRLYNTIALVITIAGLALVPFLDYVINTDLNIPHLRLYYLIALFNTVVSYLFAYKQSLISADQKMHIIQKFSMWMAIFKIILQTLVLYLTHSYTAYLCVGIVNAIAYNLLVNHQANKYYPYILKRKQIDDEEKKKIYSNVASVFLYKISSVLMDGTDNMLISVIVNTAIVGIYTNYLTVINRITQLVGSVFWSITASVGNLITEGNTKEIRKTFNQMMILGDWLGTYSVICIFCLIQEFIGLFFGWQYVFDDIVLVAILLNVYNSIVTYPVIMFREATGLYKKVRWIMFICAVENLVLSIILGKMFGTFGIILASFISRITTIFWYEANLLYKEVLGKKQYEYYLKILTNAATMLIFGAITYFATSKLNVTNLLVWLVKGCICTIIINVLYLIKYFRNDDFKVIMRKIAKVLGVRNAKA
ncbi:lipopolysaccharide biosynthesis protein [Butyrivibrio sp. XPD2006]|uniref:lipopolysaccharide biosynthesis protein n=1 Tax=Butyrivibrio sp. XPD2006 TaxID=1280668 RepID=UPI0003B5B0A4|nr:oligosaccharide flippase family protein [Butyrivibrio sp. XPD2006]